MGDTTIKSNFLRSVFFPNRPSKAKGRDSFSRWYMTRGRKCPNGTVSKTKSTRLAKVKVIHNIYVITNRWWEYPENHSFCFSMSVFTKWFVGKSSWYDSAYQRGNHILILHINTSRRIYFLTGMHTQKKKVFTSIIKYISRCNFKDTILLGDWWIQHSVISLKYKLKEECTSPGSL